MADGLTQKDLQNIRNAYIKAQELGQQIERAKACGFDCDELDQRCQLAKATCEGIISTYGPMFPQGKQ